MNQGLIPRRYAKALYKVDLDRGTAERSYQLMKTLADSFDANPDLRTAIANPFVSADDKIRLLDTAAGAAADDSTFNDFLRLLVRNNRIDMVDLMANSYVELYRRERHIHSVEVVTAAPLDPSVMDRIKALVERHLGSDATIELTSRVDPDLIGGFVVNIDNERLDTSIATQLKELRLSLLK